MIRPTASEKLEIIRLVEDSELSVKQTLEELDIPRSTFYRWYQRYQIADVAGLGEETKAPHQFWNRIPESVRDRVVHLALTYPEKSPRQLAWFMTDTESYFIWESSVYRILKRFDLITSPVFTLVSASKRFKNPTKRVNEMWQTDFTQFHIPGWGWYYLSTVLDDYSRYIIAWKLSPTMGHTDVEDTLKVAIELTGVKSIKVKHRPRLLSDNGPAYLSGELRAFMKEHKMRHIHGSPFHPQTQGKIERWHRSLKNVVNLDIFYFPWDLEAAVAQFVDDYNHRRFHESLDNLTPADVFFGRAAAILSRREEIKLATLQLRREQNLLLTVDSL